MKKVYPSRFAREAGSLVKGSSEVLHDLSGHERKIEGRLVPHQTNDVVRIVRLAQRFGVKLQAISCGRNWGFGSALPSTDNVWLVDLHEMNRIESFDPESGTVSVQPGVTQGQLSDRLIKKGNDWLFNVTGAGDSTSILGNALERGIGYFGQRHLDLIDMEVVTGTGRIISTGLGNQDRSSHPAPLGCDATSLFFQSSLGIVTKGRLRLIKRADGNGVVMARLKSARAVTAFFDKILELKRDDIISGVPHIANRPRLTTTMLPWLPEESRPRFLSNASLWTAALPLLGRKEITLAKSKLIQRSLGEISGLESFLGGKVEFKRTGCSPLEQFRQLASGYPSNLALPSVQWSALKEADLNCLDPEKTRAGLVHITPAVVSSSREIKRALKVVHQAAQFLSLDPLPLTVNIVNPQFSVIVISLPFEQPDAAIHQKARVLQEALTRAGLLPYRVGLDYSSQALGFSKSSFDVFQRLKKALDPHDIFAPSKYEPRLSSLSNSGRAHFSGWDESTGPSLLEAA